MKWPVKALIALQAPFLFIVFVMAGTDGRRESLYSVWAFVIPLGLLSPTHSSAANGDDWSGASPGRSVVRPCRETR